MATKGRVLLKQGLVAGLIGFATVVAVFAVVNVVAGRSPLYTAALLGGALFNGATDPALVRVVPSVVVAYTVVHLAVFLVFGVFAAALATLADRGSHLWYLSLFFFIFVGFHLFGAVQSLASSLRPAVSDATLWGAGIGASLLMAGYILYAHPRMRARQFW